jgi:GR25 family glycosyltransferase involved in LPS biosynthesis
MQHFAACVVSLMREPSKVKTLQEQLSRLQLQTWEITADRWINDILKLDSDPFRAELVAFVINLDRREDRYNTFLSACPIPTTRVSAVDGASLEDGRGLHTGELGCTLSHSKVWKRVVDEGLSHAIVFEDDAMFDSTFENCVEETLRHLPDDFHMCYLGGRFEKGFRCDPTLFEKTSDCLFKYDWTVEWNRSMHDRTTHAYIVSRAGARMLLHALPYIHEFAVDDWILRTFKAVNANVFSSALLPCWSPRGGDSDIQRKMSCDPQLIRITATSGNSVDVSLNAHAVSVN